MIHVFALLGAVPLDLLLGDPVYPFHPVRLIGKLIALLEKGLRRCFPKSAVGERLAGAVMTLLVLVISVGATVLLLWLCDLVSIWLRLAAELLLSYQLLAARSLEVESMRVYVQLRRGNLLKARKALSRIVGRDTEMLDEVQITKAAVETVAENTCDGVIAPLLFLLIGGAPLGMLYKAVNTMDSMVGYRNERYRYFGTAAARLDDVLNWFPARIAGLAMCLTAVGKGLDRKRAFLIFRRDRRCHLSPNSAHTEAACAGALGLQLGGGHFYFGKLVEKSTIGEEVHAPLPKNIPLTNLLMYRTEWVVLTLGVLLWLAVFLLLKL